MFSFTRYSQQDPQWRDLRLGFDPTATIGSLGCLLTDLAMVATGFGYKETPASLGQKLVALGPNVAFLGALVVPAYLPHVLPGMVFRDFLECRDTPAPMDRIDAALAAGWPVIVEVDYAPKVGLQSHWLVLYEKRNGDYLLQDPYPNPPEAGAVFLSNSRYAFAGPPAKIITSVVWLEGPRLPVNKPAGAASVFVIADGLALRAQPVIDPQNLVKRYPLLAELYSLETVDSTLQKIGSPNQWLNVQDADGAQGYVAAWNLNTKREVPGPAPVSLPPAGQPLKVYSNIDQLALRSQPLVDPATLIKRLAPGTELIVLDPPDQAAARIGVVNAWLSVKDPAGDQGYVAAWYTSANAPVGLGPVTDSPPEPPPAELHVQATVPSLAIRSRPVISPETLIKRIEVGTDLLVTEPAGEALLKIGANDQWIQVRAPDNTAGYVAAWYLKKVD
jgi:hypothetical protein